MRGQSGGVGRLIFRQDPVRACLVMIEVGSEGIKSCYAGEQIVTN